MNGNGNIERVAYSKSEVALALGISTRTVEHLITSKQLKAIRVGANRASKKAAVPDHPRCTRSIHATRCGLKN